MSEEIAMDKIIDLKGEVCPFPWVKAKKALANMPVGKVLKITVDHAPAAENIPKYFKEEDQDILSVVQTRELEWEIIVRRKK